MRIKVPMELKQVELQGLKERKDIYFLKFLFYSWEVELKSCYFWSIIVLDDSKEAN